MRMDRLPRTRQGWFAKDMHKLKEYFLETFYLVPRMEAISVFLAYACSINIKVYQMDVKSTFLNGEFEEVYIEQAEVFFLTDKKYYVCRLKKALYGLKHSPRAWYAHLDRYLQQKGFNKGSAYSNLYVRIEHDSLMIIEVYVDDIIFRSVDDNITKNFVATMQSEFEISLPGELTYFLGLQIF